jgi:chromate reductase, NAD(P)H dehydrogenase (quinone)
MITIISATNRPKSNTYTIAKAIFDRLIDQGYEAHFIDLVQLNGLSITDDMYSEAGQAPMLKEMQENVLIPSHKWIIVSPEYNGSYAGILKLWIDMLSVYRRNDTFKGTKICLVGVASGRAGNLRGMDHLTNLFHYLGAHIMPNKMPLSVIGSLLSPEDKSLLPTTLTQLHTYVGEATTYFEEPIFAE